MIIHVSYIPTPRYYSKRQKTSVSLPIPRVASSQTAATTETTVKLKFFCLFCAIPAISIAVHILATLSNFQFLTVFTQFFYQQFDIQVLQLCNSFFSIYGEIKVFHLLTCHSVLQAEHLFSLILNRGVFKALSNM